MKNEKSNIKPLLVDMQATCSDSIPTNEFTFTSNDPTGADLVEQYLNLLEKKGFISETLISRLRQEIEGYKILRDA